MNDADRVHFLGEAAWAGCGDEHNIRVLGKAEFGVSLKKHVDVLLLLTLYLGEEVEVCVYT